MKTRYFIAAAFAALLLATGCQKDYVAAELVDGKTFNAAIPPKAEAVVFEYSNSVASGTLLSTPESPVPIYGNLDGTTWRVSTSASVINANPDCSRMFWARTHYEAHSSLLVEPELNKIDFGKGFSTWNVTDMHEMFANCFDLYSLDLSNFYTGNVTNMSSMFYNCESLNSLDISNFNTKNVTNMKSMFAGCGELTRLDVSNFNTEKVTSMGGMFANCMSLRSLDLSNFNTKNVTNMGGMFIDCRFLTVLDVSNFNTQNVTNMRGMFEYCYWLESLDLSHFNMSRVTDKYDMCCGLSHASRHCTITCPLSVENAIKEIDTHITTHQIAIIGITIIQDSPQVESPSLG